MVVYLDILIFLNAIIDYCLLCLSSLIIGQKIKSIRLIVAALVASLFSLVIFLPNLNPITEIFIALSSALVTTIIAFIRKNLKLFIKFYFSFLSVSISFNGLITAIWFLAKPGGMILKNSVLYFNISALEMIFWTIISYIIIKAVLCIIRRSSPMATRCKLTLSNYDKTLELVAMVDTGNSLKDIYTGKQVIIVGKDTAKDLFGDISLIPPILLPYSTVDGVSMMSAFCCKRTKINNHEIGPSLIAVSDRNIEESDYKAIVNPQILIEGELYEKNI